MTVVTIWSRASVLPVRLQLAPAGAASDLELLVLEAIAAGVTDATELSRYFGIPRRLMIDLIGDLWRSERVTVALGEDTELIEVTGPGREAIAAAASGDYETAMRTPHLERVLLDSLSGQFVPLAASRPRLRDRRLLVPAQADDPDHRDIPPHRLAEAVARTLRKRGDSDERVGSRRVVSARLVPSLLVGAEEKRYVPLDVDVERRADGGLTFRLLESVWPPDVQRRTLERLQRLAEDAAGSAFVRALASGAGESLVESVPLGLALTRLRAASEALAATPAARRQKEHDKIAGRYHDLCHQIAELAHRETSVRLVHGKSDHDKALASVIGAATKQLLIALPWLYYDELAQHHEALESAVRRGVGITVLWGINREDETLDGRVLRLFDDISRTATAAGRGGFLHVDREQSSHVHAKVATADDRMALVTSRNLLSRSDHFEIGLLLEAPVGGRSQIAHELSAWAYNTTPNFGHASHLLRDADAYGSAGDDAPRWVIPPAPQVDLVQLGSPECSPELVNLWQRGWSEAVARIEADAVRPSPVGYLVTDGLHRSLLHAALESAERRVVVSSHKLSSRVLDGGLIEQIKHCVERGVRVSLYYGATLTEEDERAIVRLEDSCRGASGRLEVVHRASLHAKVLAFDDEVVVGSYNFLSFDAAYGAGRWSQRAEVSVRIVDRPFTDTVVKLLATTHFRGGSRTAGPVADVRHIGPAALAGRVVEMLAGSEAVDVTAIGQVVDEDATLEAVHRELEASGTSLRTTRRLDAALVASGGAAVRERALRGLLRRSWELGDVVVAHVVRSEIESDVRPRAVLTAVAAAVLEAAGDAEDLVAEIMLAEGVDPGERQCVAVLRMISILRTGDTARATGGVVEGLDDVPELVRWHQVATDYVVVHGALPVGLAAIMRDAADTRVEETWASIPPLVDRLAKWKPGHRESEQTKDYLVAEPLRRLREIAVSRDGSALAAWSAAHRGTTDGGWLDDQVHKAGVSVRIDGDRRRYLLEVTRPLLLAARALARATTSPEAEAVEGVQLEALRQLGGMTTSLLSVLPEETDLSPARAELARLGEELGGVEPA